MRSLRTITTVYSIAFVLAILSASIVLYVVSARSLVSEVDTRLSTESSTLLDDGGQDLALVSARVRQNEALRANSDLSYLLVDPRGTALAGKLRMRIPAPGFSNVEYTDGVEGIDRGRALATRLNDGSHLLLVADYGPVEDFNLRVLQIGTVALLIILAIGLFGSLAFSRAISARIEATTQIAESIIRGELDRRMPIDGTGGVFDRQAAVLNTMLDRIQSLMLNLQQISSDVAHDLRTPLMRLRNNASRLVAVTPSHVQARDLKQIVAQSEQLLVLFGAILRITEVEAGSRRAYFKPVDLGALALELVATFSPAVEAGGGRLQGGAVEGLVIEGDRELISQALINLVDNAGKYAGPGAEIVLTVTLRGDEAYIVVSDDGPGIAVQDRETALRRFGRLDGSRSRPGNGLGLSLVASAARLHGGRLLLQDANPGLAAIIALPLTSE